MSSLKKQIERKAGCDVLGTLKKEEMRSKSKMYVGISNRYFAKQQQCFRSVCAATQHVASYCSKPAEPSLLSFNAAAIFNNSTAL